MTSFFDQVYAVVRQIPPGKIASYGQIAALLGHPRAARTVGWALAALREQEERDVPWQRVVNAAGGCSTDRLPDFPKGLQRSLLEEEGVGFRRNGTLDLELYRWWPPRGRRD